MFKKADKFEQPEEKSTKCEAYGCKLRGTVTMGGGWCCFAHVSAPGSEWQNVTRKLNEHDWLTAFVRDVRRMANACEDWRGFATAFWDGSDDYCKPMAFEEDVPYTNRMLDECLYRCGVIAKRPAPREPKKVDRPNRQFFI